MSDRSCTSYDELSQCLTCDPTNIPVVEGNLFNMTAPISQSDVNYLSGGRDPNGAVTGIDFFADPGTVTTGDASNPLSFARDSGLVRVGLRFRTQFLLDSICVKIHCEPQSGSIDGNQFFSQSAVITAVNAGNFPVSPEEFNFDILGGSGAAVNGVLTHCNAQMEIGAPIWRAAAFALQAYRLSLQCPSSPRVHEIYNQRLIDIGNCCLGTEWEGFGTSDMSVRDYILKANLKMNFLTSLGLAPVLPTDYAAGVACISNGITTANQDLGFFVPFNSRQLLRWNETQQRLMRHTEASRMRVRPSAFGAPSASPDAYKWYRLAIPRVIDKDENIEITLGRSSADREFFERFIRELSYQACNNLIPGTTEPAGGANVLLGDGASYTSFTAARYVRIPFGQMRFGISLKGWEMSANLCGSIKERFNSMSLSEYMSTPEATVRAGKGTGTVMIPAGGKRLSDYIMDKTGVSSCGCGG